VPQHKSCKKRMKTSTERRLRNRAKRSYLRSAIQDVRSEKDKEKAIKKLSQVSSLLDRASASRLIHRRTAARSKSRLARLVSGLE
jgi:small subunit ribosomal protein S20